MRGNPPRCWERAGAGEGPGGGQGAAGLQAAAHRAPAGLNVSLGAAAPLAGGSRPRPRSPRPGSATARPAARPATRWPPPRPQHGLHHRGRALLGGMANSRLPERDSGCGTDGTEPGGGTAAWGGAKGRWREGRGAGRG